MNPLLARSSRDARAGRAAPGRPRAPPRSRRRASGWSSRPRPASRRPAGRSRGSGRRRRSRPARRGSRRRRPGPPARPRARAAAALFVTISASSAPVSATRCSSASRYRRPRRPVARSSSRNSVPAAASAAARIAASGHGARPRFVCTMTPVALMTRVGPAATARAPRAGRGRRRRAPPVIGRRPPRQPRAAPAPRPPRRGPARPAHRDRAPRPAGARPRARARRWVASLGTSRRSPADHRRPRSVRHLRRQSAGRIARASGHRGAVTPSINACSASMCVPSAVRPSGVSEIQVVRRPRCTPLRRFT